MAAACNCWVASHVPTALAACWLPPVEPIKLCCATRASRSRAISENNSSLHLEPCLVLEASSLFAGDMAPGEVQEAAVLSVVVRSLNAIEGSGGLSGAIPNNLSYLGTRSCSSTNLLENSAAETKSLSGSGGEGAASSTSLGTGNPCDSGCFLEVLLPSCLLRTCMASVGIEGSGSAAAASGLRVPEVR